MEKKVFRATPGRAVRVVRAGWQDGRANGAGPDDG